MRYWMMPLFPMRVISPIKLEELYRLSPTFGSSTISISTGCKVDRLVPEKCSKAGAQVQHGSDGNYCNARQWAYQLSYSHQGKSTTRFVRHVAKIRKELAAYKRFRGLTQEWLTLALTLSQLRLEQARRERVAENPVLSS